jgi:hypothetical protein
MSDVTDARARGPVDPNEAAMAALGSAQEHAHHTRRAVERLERVMRGLAEPPRFSTHALTAQTPIVRDEVTDAALSIGILNPNPIPVWVGVAGGSATAAARAPSLPPSSALVLPIAVADLELGADPADLAAGDAVIFLFRFPTVQPLLLTRA